LSVFIDSFFAHCFLTFGARRNLVPLTNLNILIGPNASGKSNFIEAFRLLRALPDDLAHFIAAGGGSSEWVWKRPPVSRPELGYFATLEIHHRRKNGTRLRHSFSLGGHGVLASFFHEIVAVAKGDKEQILFGDGGGETMPAIQSAVQRPSGKHAEVLSELADRYRAIQVFRGARIHEPGGLKEPQNAGLPANFLLESGVNLGAVLNELRLRPANRNRILDALKDVNSRVVDFQLRLIGGSSLLYFDEGMFEQIPITRVSDGTIRYLCLLAILLHDKPPPLILIEEPEVGLHPDLLRPVARLIKEASQKTQLIVTTHSPTIVDAFTDEPESIIVCERDDEGTRMERLSRKALKHWLEDYSLGRLWTSGEIGGNRW